MKDVTRKPETLRSARAMSTIHVPAFCIPLVRERRTEKGDAIEAARFAATMAVKRTWELIPLCHPLPIQDVKVHFELGTDRIDSEVMVRAIANTGVEMEALSGASVAALTFYDMLKPHAGTRLSIDNVHLIEKLGGKSHYLRHIDAPAGGAVLAASASALPTAEAVCERLTSAGIRCAAPEAIADDEPAFEQSVRRHAHAGIALLALVGGVDLTDTGDTAGRLRPLLERPLPGLTETARHHLQSRSPYGMLMRGCGGLIGDTIVVTLPADAATADEYLDALIPGLVHAIATLRQAHQAPLPATPA